MSRTAYRRSKKFVEDLSVCTVHMHNGDEVGLSPRRRAIVRALNCLATPRQRQCMYLYYGRRLNQQTISQLLQIDISTVSRNITHGEEKIMSAKPLFDQDE